MATFHTVYENALFTKPNPVSNAIVDAMVLLSSSSVSVLISSGIIALFTFLLFLAGWVLQQQSIRSLQEALHPPPLPKPTLPTYFSELSQQQLESKQFGDDNRPELQVVVGGVASEDDAEAAATQETKPKEPELSSEEIVQKLVAQQFGSPLDSRRHGTHTQEIIVNDDGADKTSPENDASEEAIIISGTSPHQAIMQILDPDTPSKSALCSALSFFKTLSAMHNPNPSSIIPDRLLWYPESWNSKRSTAPLIRTLHTARTTFNLTLSSHRDEYLTSQSLLRDLKSSADLRTYTQTLLINAPGLLQDPAPLSLSLSQIQVDDDLENENPRTWRAMKEDDEDSRPGYPLIAFHKESYNALLPTKTTRRKLVAMIVRGKTPTEEEEGAAYVVLSRQKAAEGEEEHDDVPWVASTREKWKDEGLKVCRELGLDIEESDWW